MNFRTHQKLFLQPQCIPLSYNNQSWLKAVNVRRPSCKVPICLSVCVSGFPKIVVCRQILLLIPNMNFQEDSSVGDMQTREFDNPNSRIFLQTNGPKRGYILFQIYVIVPFSTRFIFLPKNDGIEFEACSF